MFRLCFYVKSEKQFQIFHNVVKFYDLFDKFIVICGFKSNRHIYYLDWNIYQFKWAMLEDCDIYSKEDLRKREIVKNRLDLISKERSL